MKSDERQAFDLHVMFIAMKRHFSSKYDYHKFNGKVKASTWSFNKRNDQKVFFSLAKKFKEQSMDSFKNYLVAGILVHGNNLQAYMLFEDKIVDQFVLLEKWLNSGEYFFKQDIETIINHLQLQRMTTRDLFTIPENGDFPYIIKLWLSGNISVFTILVIDKLTNFLEILDRKINNIIWIHKYDFLLNLKDFLVKDIDVPKYRIILGQLCTDKPKKLGIIGTRTFNDYELLKSEVDKIPTKLIISGGATGADLLAEEYAMKNNISLITHIADWDKHGKSAGPIRNKLIVEHSDFILAFWDGQSKGTKNCLQIAKKLGKPFKIVRYK